MALNETSKEFISLKKLQGKAHTSNNKGLANEALSSGLTVSAKTVFSTDIPASPTSTLYAISGAAVQYVRLSASFIAGSDTVAGRHAFELKLPDDFQTPAGTTNSLSKKGSGVFVNQQVVNTTAGALQLVPPSYGTSYEAKPYYFVNGSGPETQIPVLDARDWYIDYFNGILFQQDPPGTGDHAQNPRFVDAYIFVGDFVTDSLSSAGTGSGDGDKSAQYVVLAATGSLTNERVLTPGTGLDLTDGGAGGNITLDVDISEFSDVQVATGDKFLMLDQDGSTHQLESIDDISTFQAGDGLVASSGVLAVNIADMSSELASATVADTDEFAISDGGTMKKVDFQHVRDSVFADVSGDATVAAGGALTIGTGVVQADMLNDDIVSGQAEMTGDVADTDEILVSDGGVVKRADFSVLRDAVFNDVSGDATIAAGGALTIGTGAVESGMINNNVISGQTEMTGDVDDTDEILISDGGTVKRADFSVLRDAVFNDVSGDATIAAGGALTIAANAVEDSMVNDNVAVGLAGDGLAATTGVLSVGVDDSTIETSGDALRIKDAGVTLAKLANVANLKVLGNVSGGAAAPAAIDIDTDLSSVSGTDNTLASAKSIKSYVDAQIAGLDVKASVVVASTASFTMASTASASTLVLADGEGGFDATANTLTIDGVSVAAASRVLIKDGVNSNGSGVNNKWNGVYTVGVLTDATLTLTRATDFDAGSEFTGAPFFMVEKGSDNGAHGFVCNLTTDPTVGTDPITFYQFTAPGQDAVAGSGLAMSGNVLSVDIDELSALGGTGIAQSDNLMFSDAGTEKKITFSNLEDAIFGNVSGDATIAAGGALTIGADAVQAGMLNDDIISGQAEMTGDVADADEILISDGGVVKRADFSVLRDAVFNDVSGDASIASGGALTTDAVKIAKVNTVTVTVSGGKFVLDGVSQKEAILNKGFRYKFDQSAGTNASHPLRFSTTSDGTHGGGSTYSTGVTVNGTAGSAGAYVLIDLTQATPDTLYYYCTNHSGMGAAAQSGDGFAVLAGDGLDKTGTTFSLDLKSSGGLKIDSTELAIEPADFAGSGLEDDGSDNLRLNVHGLGADSNAGNLSDSIAIADASDSNVTKKITLTQLKTLIDTDTNFTAGDGLDLSSTTFSLDLKSSGGLKIDSTELAIEPADFAGVGLEDDGSDNLRMHVHGLSADSNAGNLSDAIAIADASDSNLTKKITLTQLKTVLGVGGAIDYSGDDSLIKSATDGTSSGENISVANTDLVLVQDVTDGNVKFVQASQLPGASGSGTIGAAEDGDYTDGLFTDFTTTTPTGTPIDRFNEVLKLLVPTPGPDLDDIDSNVSSGVAGDLSFGAANDQSSASPAYITVANTAGLGTAADVNTLYTTATNGNNLRRGLFNGSVDHTGDLNEDIAADITSPSSRTNFPANSFGNADIGSLILEVNGANLVTADLTDNSTGAGSPGSGSGTEVNGNGSGFTNLSAATAGTFDNGTSFASFKHRTGKWKVAAADQRNGWNYVRVKHDKGGGSVVTTNYVEWVNDNDSSALAASSNTLAYSGTGSKQISGVTYFTGGTGRYQVTVSNAYKYVYDKTTDHTFTTSNSGTNSGVSYSISAITPADVGGSEDHTKQIVVDETDTVTANYMLNGSITAGISVAHPLKTNLTNAGQASASGILLYNVTDTATALSETFQDESYRLKDVTYTNQSDAASGNAWDSSVSLVHGSDTAHNTGLQVFRERLYAPGNTILSGDFRNTGDGGSLANGPAGNPNYSGASGTRTYYRKFQNTSGGAVRDFSYTLAGDVDLVGASDSIGSNKNFKLSFKMPNDGSGNVTGFLDAKNAFVLGSTADADGGAIGTVDTVDTMTNHVSFGTVEIGANEYVVAKIEASHQWTGYIDSLTLSFGAVGSVASSPNVGDLDVNQTGTDANLSFGDVLTKTGYTNVETTAGGSERNANDLYSVASKRYGIFDKTTAITGEINESTTASSNAYPANAFGSGVANTGTLFLFVNTTSTGASDALHSVDLSSFSSGDSLVGGAGTSGFTNISAATNGRDGSNLPNFTKWWRTGSYRVATANQRNGFNFARVIHRISGVDHVSAYVEWVNDDDGSTVTYSNVAVGDFSESGSSYSLSGVTYFVSPVGKFHFTVANLYKYVYSDASNAIRFPTSTNCTFTQIEARGAGVTNATTSAAFTTLPVLDTSVSSAYDQNLIVTGSFSVDSSTSIPGSLQNVTIVGRVNHPLKGNVNTSSTSSGNLLIFTDTDTSTTLVENFDGETKRLQSGTYTQQSHVTVGSNAWDSTVSLVHGSDTGHNAGLMIFNGKLVGFVGSQNTNTNFGALIGPSGNPDYSSVSAGDREYIRWFRNTEGAARQMFQITINGSGTIVAAGGSLGANANLKIAFKIPSSNASQSTGWMDIASTFSTGQYADDDGCFDSGNGSFDSSLNATNWGTFGTHFVNNNEYILMRVKAHSTWTGNITQATLAWRTA